MLSQLSLTKKLTVFLVAFVAISTLLMLAYQLYERKESLYQSECAKNKITASLLTAQSAGGIQWKKAVILEKVYTGFEGGNFSHMQAFADDASPIVNLHQEGLEEKDFSALIEQYTDKLTAGEVIDAEHGDDMVFIMPAFSSKGEFVGTLVTAWDTTHLHDTQLKEVVKQLGVGCMYLILLIAVVLFLVKKNLKEPLSALLNHVSKTMDGVVESAAKMNEMSNVMASSAEETSAQGSLVAQSSSQASRNVHEVTVAAEQLQRSLEEVSNNVRDAAEQVRSASEQASSSNAVIESLSEATSHIANVTSLIADIAEQTNLLALNASIEAARAGDAGRGFSVVADEIKKLATHTTNATQDISKHVQNITKVSGQSRDALEGIVESVGAIEGKANHVMQAVQEQTVVTQDIISNMYEASERVKEVDSNIGGVSEASQDVGQTATETLKQMTELSEKATTLQKHIEEFASKV